MNDLPTLQVVVYHAVKPENRTSPFQYHLTTQEFVDQLRHFMQLGTIVGPNWLHNPVPVNGPAYLLTFDDGLKEHFSEVFPILKSFGVEALFFVNSLQLLDRRLLNVHRLHYLQQQFGERFVERCHQAVAYYAKDLLPGLPESVAYEGLNQPALLTELKSIINFRLSPSAQDQLCKALMEDFAVDESLLSTEYYMQANELQMLVEAGMHLGGHGHTHFLLSNLGEAAQQSELQQNADIIANLTNGNNPTFFCYPYGYRESYNQQTIHLLQGLGYAMAFETGNRGISATDLDSNRWQLGRVDCNRFFPLAKNI